MKKTKFKLEEYLTYYYEKNIDVIDDEDIDDFETKRDTLGRNIRNLTKNFKKEIDIKEFDFNTNIFNYFPMYQLEKDDIYKFIDHIISLKGVGNKVLANMKKINIDNVDVEAVYLNPPQISDFQKDYTNIKQSYRIAIRKNLRDYHKIIENFDNLIDQLKKENNLSDFGLITSITFDILFQMITYWVVCVPPIDHNLRVDYIKVIDDYLDDFEKNYEKNYNFNNDLNLNDCVTIFIEFLKSYNYCGEYLNIMTKLKEEELNSPELFKDIKDEYKTRKGTSYKTVKYKEIITEGQEIYEFNDKFEKTKKAIAILQNNGVNVSDINDLYDLKVYFREIYISNCKYKSKASTIIRKMTDKSVTDFENTSDYMFIREKISRGCFRELFPLSLYDIKVELQQKLYKILLKVMLSYDYQTGLVLFNKLVTDLTPMCLVILDKYYQENDIERVFKD